MTPGREKLRLAEAAQKDVQAKEEAVQKATKTLQKINATITESETPKDVQPTDVQPAVVESKVRGRRRGDARGWV